jgi:hypothetical protein
MKWAILFLLLCNPPAYAQNCKLEIGTDFIELATLESGCEFPEGNKVNCSVLRSADETGISTFRADTNLNSFCFNADYELFGSSKTTGPKAYMQCKDKKAVSIKLQSGDGKASKICKLPF